MNLIPSEKGKQSNLVVKANRLMEAKFQFKLWEMRVFEKMISLINREDKEFRLCKIYIKDLIRFFQGNSRNDYELVREAANSLGDKKLYIPYNSAKGHKRWAKISIFPTITMPDEESRVGENAYVELEFHRDLRPYLLDLKERFKSYSIDNIKNLRSIYSIRMFILLKQYENLGKREFEVETLRDILGIDPEQYRLYGDFKKRVILRPQKDLEKHCDIRFNFKERKIGRKVVAVIFQILKNQPGQKTKTINKSQSGEEKPKINKDPVFDAFFELVKDWNITKTTLKRYLKTYSRAHIEARIVFLKNLQKSKKSKIENPAGYFHRLLEQNQISDPEENQKQENAQKRAQRAQIKKQVAYLQQELEKLSKAKNEAVRANVIAFFDKDPEAKLSIMEAAKRKKMSGYNSKKGEIENYQSNPMFRGAVHAKIAETYPEQFKKINETYIPKIKELERKIKELK